MTIGRRASGRPSDAVIHIDHVGESAPGTEVPAQLSRTAAGVVEAAERGVTASSG